MINALLPLPPGVAPNGALREKLGWRSLDNLGCTELVHFRSFDCASAENDVTDSSRSVLNRKGLPQLVNLKAAV